MQDNVLDYAAMVRRWQAQRDQVLAQGPYPCQTEGCANQVPWPHTICADCTKTKEARESAGRLALSPIPATFRSWARFGNSALAARVKGGAPTVERARECLELLRTRAVTTAVLSGPAGLGKSSLLAAMLAEVIQRSETLEVWWIDAYALGRAYRTHPLGDLPEPINKSMSAGLLAIDDIGNEPDTDRAPLKEVIHERHAQGRPTMVTTAHTPATIYSMYGDNIARRLYERAVVIDLGFDSAAAVRAA